MTKPVDIMQITVAEKPGSAKRKYYAVAVLSVQCKGARFGVCYQGPFRVKFGDAEADGERVRAWCEEQNGKGG